MCGIAGVLGGGPSLAAAAGPMIGALAHRGPDGVRSETLPGAAFAHARLSIIDLEGGWQPLHAAGGSVIGNGEIYNYVELTRDFGLEGRLATGSDFEPLLHLYALEGPAAFERLRGMYALCLAGHDGRTWLARDPFGIKPLYLLETDQGLAFASEPRAFVAAGLISPQLDPLAARELLDLNYVLGDRTALKGLRALEPGELLEVADGRIIGRHRKAPLPSRPPKPPADEAAALAALDRVLTDSVAVHQRSDVPYGLFLSGGVDSAVIATLMARLNTRPVTAFTCGFDAPGAADERSAAEAVARALGLDWREVSFGEADFWASVPQAAWALDQPTADYAVLPTLKLAEAARGTLTVVLTGEGGDELFAGYGRYRRALRPRWLGGRPAEPRGTTSQTLSAWREAARPPRSNLSRGLTPLQAAQWADVATWLPADLLLKLDRCLMAHGLEGRTPFLDPEVAAFAWSLPDRMKVRDGVGKWIVRRWLETACPAARPWAKKQGFTVPVETWIAPRAADIAPRLGQVQAVRELIGPDAADRFRNATERRYALLFFAVWSLIHLEKAEPGEAMAMLLGES